MTLEGNDLYQNLSGSIGNGSDSYEMTNDLTQQLRTAPIQQNDLVEAAIAYLGELEHDESMLPFGHEKLTSQERLRIVKEVLADFVLAKDMSDALKG